MRSEKNADDVGREAVRYLALQLMEIVLAVAVIGVALYAFIKWVWTN